MLPANPLQHLLLQEMKGPLVMTSGNLSGRPPAITNAQALDDLHDIADGFCCITARLCSAWMTPWCAKAGRCCVAPEATCRMPWRCRGFRDVPPMLCLGADLKNTFCLIRGTGGD